MKLPAAQNGKGQTKRIKYLHKPDGYLSFLQTASGHKLKVVGKVLN